MNTITWTSLNTSLHFVFQVGNANAVSTERARSRKGLRKWQPSRPVVVVVVGGDGRGNEREKKGNECKPGIAGLVVVRRWCNRPPEADARGDGAEDAGRSSLHVVMA